MSSGMNVTRVFASAWIAFFLNSSPTAASPPTDSQRIQLLASVVVGAAVVDALAVDSAVRVIVAFEAPSVATRGPRRTRRVDPEVMVRIAQTADGLLAGFAPGEFTLHYRYGAIPAIVGSVRTEGLLRLLADPRVLHIDVDEGGAGSLGESVPLVNLDDLQTLGHSGSGVQVAMLDSGVESTHPDVGNAVIAEQCFCSGGGGCCPNGSSTQSGPGSAEDDSGHGTRTAGDITSDGLVAPVGGAPGAEIVSIKVLDSAQSFCCFSDVIAGLDWILMNRPDVDVVNMSFGSTALFTGACDDFGATTMAVSAAINALRANGVVVVAAAGNAGSGTQIGLPACIENAVAVGAVWDANVGPISCESSTQPDQVACFSNSNSTTDLFAPGALVTTSQIGSTTATALGTSHSAALVSACAAALIGAAPAATGAAIEAALVTSSVVVTDPKNGLSFPRLDCAAALAALLPDKVPALTPSGRAGLAAALLAGGLAWANRKRRAGGAS